MKEPLIYAEGCDARTFNTNLKRFLRQHVGVDARIGVGKSTRKGITVGDQYVNARLDYDKVQKGEVKWPDLFRQLCALAVYPDLCGKDLQRAVLGNIMTNMITISGKQWEKVAQQWYSDRDYMWDFIAFRSSEPSYYVQLVGAMLELFPMADRNQVHAMLRPIDYRIMAEAKAGKEPATLALELKDEALKAIEDRAQALLENGPTLFRG